MRTFLPACVLLLAVSAAQADWRDLLGLGRRSATNQVSNPGGLNSLTDEQVALGLKEALGKGLQTAVQQLGREGGFLTNVAVKIPMPPQLRRVESTLRSLKQDQLADQFVAAMNRAAERAVPEATAVFSDALKNMTVMDAKDILTGPDDAATRYFRRQTETNLTARFLPIVQKATGEAGVTQSYKQLTAAVQQNQLLGALAGAYLDPKSLDLDRYVTEKSLDGLFRVVAQEEKRIRENPLARTSLLLERVFGAASRK